MKQYQITPTDATCPACLTTEAAILYSITSREAAQHYVLQESHPERFSALQRHIEVLWEAESAQVLQCQACRFCFANPFVAGDETFYTLAYERTGYPKAKWEFDVTVQALRRLVPTSPGPARLLEIGAGDGAFIRLIAPSLLPLDSVLSTEFSDYGCARIRQSGIECRQVDVRSSALDDQRGQLSFICLFQVLEHLDRLDDLFERFRELAVPGGHLFIAVPNNRLIEFNELSGSLLDLPPNHVGRWTRSSFEQIGSRHGWKLADYQIEPDSAIIKMREHGQYRYMKARQKPGSFANRAEAAPPGVVRTARRTVAAGAVALATVPALFQALTSPGLGGSQWAHLTKLPDDAV